MISAEIAAALPPTMALGDDGVRSRLNRIIKPVIREVAQAYE